MDISQSVCIEETRKEFVRSKKDRETLNRYHKNRTIHRHTELCDSLERNELQAEGKMQ